MPAGLRASDAALADADVLRLSARSPRPKTSSPTANSVTAEPTASTSPASSVPTTLRFGRTESGEETREERVGSAERRSHLRVTVVAWILTRTSSSSGTGRSISAGRSASGGPYLSWTTALMRPSVDRHYVMAFHRAAQRSGAMPSHGCEATPAGARRTPVGDEVIARGLRAYSSSPRWAAIEQQSAVSR